MLRGDPKAHERPILVPETIGSDAALVILTDGNRESRTAGLDGAGPVTWGGKPSATPPHSFEPESQAAVQSRCPSRPNAHLANNRFRHLDDRKRDGRLGDRPVERARVVGVARAGSRGQRLSLSVGVAGISGAGRP